jgi:molybdenum cofactor cytidylyltransferase
MPDASNHQDPVAVYAIIPAAGRSLRMGQLKQLMPYGDRTILETVIETVLAGPVNGLVVVANSDIDDELDLSEDPRFVTAINDDAESQMLDSILLGLDTLAAAFDLPRHCGVCVCPGDMPGIDVASVTACVNQFRQHADRIVVATFQAKRGHPIIVPHPMTAELAEITEGGLAELLHRHTDKLHPVECETPGVTKDIDTPGDYQDPGQS